MLEFTIPGTLPTLNEYVDVCRGNKHKAARWKKDIEAMIGLHIKIAKLPKLSFGDKDYPVKILVRFYRPDKRTDRDNVFHGIKYIQDALVSNGIIRNDGYNDVDDPLLFVHCDASNPRTVVKLFGCSEV